MTVTKQDRENCIGYKSLLIARDRQGQIVRVTSPITLAAWEWDGATWTLRAAQEPTQENKLGVYAVYTKKQARQYRGSICKVILSGRVVMGTKGARGQVARLLEVEEVKNVRYW